jgi:hypothetical protein
MCSRHRPDNGADSGTDTDRYTYADNETDADALTERIGATAIVGFPDTIRNAVRNAFRDAYEKAYYAGIIWGRLDATKYQHSEVSDPAYD